MVIVINTVRELEEADRDTKKFSRCCFPFGGFIFKELLALDNLNHNKIRGNK